MHFDVFLSHNSQDKPEVERVAERLKREGIEAWLDIWCLTPGGDWQDELAQGLRVSPACAVFVGAHGIGDWERLELNLATDRMAKDRTFRVFLVLLPGLREPFDTSTLPPFLSTRAWVDLRKGIFDPRGVQLLIGAGSAPFSLARSSGSALGSCCSSRWCMLGEPLTGPTGVTRRHSHGSPRVCGRQWDHAVL